MCRCMARTCQSCAAQLKPHCLAAGGAAPLGGQGGLVGAGGLASPWLAAPGAARFMVCSLYHPG